MSGSIGGQTGPERTSLERIASALERIALALEVGNAVPRALPGVPIPQLQPGQCFFCGKYHGHSACPEIAPMALTPVRPA